MPEAVVSSQHFALLNAFWMRPHVPAAGAGAAAPFAKSRAHEASKVLIQADRNIFMRCLSIWRRSQKKIGRKKITVKENRGEGEAKRRKAEPSS
jgi:hypothetical protein